MLMSKATGAIAGAGAGAACGSGGGAGATCGSGGGAGTDAGAGAVSADGAPSASAGARMIFVFFLQVLLSSLRREDGWSKDTPGTQPSE